MAASTTSTSAAGSKVLSCCPGEADDSPGGVGIHGKYWSIGSLRRGGGTGASGGVCNGGNTGDVGRMSPPPPPRCHSRSPNVQLITTASTPPDAPSMVGCTSQCLLFLLSTGPRVPLRWSIQSCGVPFHTVHYETGHHHNCARSRWNLEPCRNMSQRMTLPQYPH